MAPTGQGVLQLGSPSIRSKVKTMVTYNKLGEQKPPKIPKKSTIWAEYEKITNGEHKSFYSSLVGAGKEWRITFVVISNKPLGDFEHIRANPELLPPDTIVVCHENFQDYCSLMCTYGVFIPVIYYLFLFLFLFCLFLFIFCFFVFV